MSVPRLLFDTAGPPFPAPAGYAAASPRVAGLEAIRGKLLATMSGSCGWARDNRNGTCGLQDGA
jgi:hypothetical protein